MSLGPLTARLFRAMADHLDDTGSAPMDEDALDDAAKATTTSRLTAGLAAANAPDITPGQTRGQYAERLREAAEENT